MNSAVLEVNGLAEHLIGNQNKFSEENNKNKEKNKPHKFQSIPRYVDSDFLKSYSPSPKKPRNRDLGN